MAPLVSLIVPVLEDSRAAAGLLAGVLPAPEVEVILIDGGADPALDVLAASRPDVRLLRAAAGRGRQMNAGARAAAGEWLLFVHADSRMPGGWLDLLRTRARHAVGGWFAFALDHPGWQARLLERIVAWRVRLWRLPYGDQGLFVRRATFEAIGGYREIPLMEDVEFVGRLRRAGPVVELPAPLVTSARRWERDGWFRRSAQNAVLLALYWVGVAPERLERWYRMDRRHRGG